MLKVICRFCRKLFKSWSDWDVKTLVSDWKVVLLCNALVSYFTSGVSGS